MASSVVDFPNLRAGVAAVRVPRGLLFHDALRWKLFLVPEEQSPEVTLAWLEENGLLAGSPFPTEEKRRSQLFLLDRARAPEGDFTLLGEARFRCSQCGASCRSLNLGPLFPSDVGELQRQDWTGTGRDPSTFFVTRDGEEPDEEQRTEGRELFLRRVGGACQFLTAENRCEVHERFGADAKPQMCRAFPIQLRATPGGVAVGLRLAECFQAEAASEGPSLDQEAGDLRQLWNEMAEVPSAPPLLWLAPGVLASWETYESLERELLLSPPAAPFPGQAAGGGLAFLLRALATVMARAGLEAPAPCPPEELAALRAWAVEDDEPPNALPLARTMALPLARTTAAALDEGALKLEERICRLLLFNKDALQHEDVVAGAALLVVRADLSRQRALDLAGRDRATLATAAHLNRGSQELVHAGIRDEIEHRGLDVRAVAAAVAAAHRGI